MTRTDILLRTWEVSNDVKSWFVPVRKALEHVDVDQAVWKPEGVACFNSI